MTEAEKALFGIEKLNVPRSEIPAVTHVDYSARLQTVHADTNPRFHALLSAFAQDVTTTRYATFTDLLDYCRRSANPVGLLMLTLYGAADPANADLVLSLATVASWSTTQRPTSQAWP